MTPVDDQHPNNSGAKTHADQTMNIACRICGSIDKRRFFTAVERQFGMGDEFTYFECGGCGSLCINSVPTKLSKYYPPHYYSFGRSDGQKPGDIGWFRRKLRAHRAMFNIYGSDMLGAVVQRLGTDYFTYPWRWFRAAGVTPSSAILDNGCGGGALLRALRDQGFTNLSGVDPFIAESINEPYLQITKGEIFDLKGPYDLVMFHHSLEHVAEPARYLTAAAEVCAPGGAVIVRIPVADGYGWREYGEYWFALDAPRHLAIPTKESMEMLGADCGLVLESTVCDSEAVCFWGSELYKRGVPAINTNGQCAVNETVTADNPFSENEMTIFRRRATEINEANDGDLACFIFRKPVATSQGH